MLVTKLSVLNFVSSDRFLSAGRNEGSVFPMQKLYFLSFFLWVEEREFAVLIDRPFTHL